ncbi:hypothetical protein [Streptomyces sparsus]
MGAGLIHALAAVGDDQGDERAGPGDHAEGELTKSKSVAASSFAVRSISRKSSSTTSP